MNPFGQAWRGEARLPLVFWGYYLLLPTTLWLLLALQIQVLGDVPYTLGTGILATTVTYVVWVHVALWRCSKRSRTLTRVAVKSWVTVVFLFIIASIVLMPTSCYRTARSKVIEGMVPASAARTAVSEACSENTLRAGMSNEAFGLAPPGNFNSDYVQSITAVGMSDTEARIIVIMKDIYEDSSFWNSRVVTAGSTIVHTGRCTPDRITWTVSGTVPEKYLPRR